MLPSNYYKRRRRRNRRLTLERSSKKSTILQRQTLSYSSSIMYVAFLLIVVTTYPTSMRWGVEALSTLQRRLHSHPKCQRRLLDNTLCSFRRTIFSPCRQRYTNLLGVTKQPCDSFTSVQDDEIKWRKKAIMEFIKDNKLQRALQGIQEMVVMVEAETNPEIKKKASREADQALETFTSRAFQLPFQGNAAQSRVKLGMDALTLQLSSQLAFPYNLVEKRVFLKALGALTGINEVLQHRSALLEYDSSYSSFRILQRLVTGAGIRRKDISKAKYNNGSIQEKDFNMVLNSFSNIGRMDMAHKIIALQERTEHAPPLSPVAYSILLKGYGRLKDLTSVELIVRQAEADDIVPDTIMLNSLMDAYINCNATEKAKGVFYYMTNWKCGTMSEMDQFYWNGTTIANQQPQANRRTYNTMLKGLAKTGSLKQCLELSQEMERKGLWDDITTNTLVHAAVTARDLEQAQSLLDRYTSTIRSPQGNSKRTGWHPNVEAYTELLDGYAKAGELDTALQVLQTMKDRGVEPNVFTYTCLVAALARIGKVDQAKKMMRYMESTVGIKPSAITYNAFLCALISDAHLDETAALTDHQVDEALRVFYTMMKSGIQPNGVTVSVLILAMGRCQPLARVEEAKALVAKLEANGIVKTAEDEKIATALINACGRSKDLEGAIEAFRKLRKPDLVAVNSFLDACTRCDNDQVAVKTFVQYFGGKDTPAKLDPDVISYSIIISGLLKKNTINASKEAQQYYDEMKTLHSIFPDNEMVDLILKCIIRTGRLQKKDVHLVASVVRDAEKLQWRPGQLERRKRAIQAVLSSGPGAWLDESVDDDMLRREIKSDNALFKRKGWNEVDSGFRLWGGGKMDIKAADEKSHDGVDDFLQSKGWNNVESGFRII